MPEAKVVDMVFRQHLVLPVALAAELETTIRLVVLQKLLVVLLLKQLRVH